MTLVYQELSQRIYSIIMKCSLRGIEKCLNTGEEIQNKLIYQFNLCKYMFEVGNMEMADYLKAKLSEEYPDNTMYNFYDFLYNIENQNFEPAREYLRQPLKGKYIPGEYFV